MIQAPSLKYVSSVSFTQSLLTVDLTAYLLSSSMSEGWKRLHLDTHLTDAPRSLYVSEIAQILSHLKQIPSPFVECSSVAFCNLVNHVGRSLREIKLCPSALDAFAKEMVAKQIHNMCEPGYAMGSTTGSALGSINTQTMLNTFKSSGLADTGSREVAATENLVYARPSPKADYCTIHFTDKRIGMFDALLKTYEVDQFTMKDAFLSSCVEYEIFKLPLDFDQPEWFYATMTDTFKDHMTKSSCITELRLDSAKLAVRGVSMVDVVMALQANGMCVTWSSLEEGRVFVIPKIGEPVSEEHLEDIHRYTCFTTLFIDNAHTIFLKGIPGQSDSEPTLLNLTTLVGETTPVSEDDLEFAYTNLTDRLFVNDGGVVYRKRDFKLLDWPGSLSDEEERCPDDKRKWWKVRVDRLSLKVNGLKLDRIAECLFTCGVSDVRRCKDIDWVSMLPAGLNVCATPDDHCLIIRCKRDPKALLLSCQAHLKESISNVDVNPFVYVYIKSKGINLKSICSLPFVDTETSTCVNAHVMTKTFGIVNAMMAFVHTIHTTFSYSNQSFHPARVQMMCDHLTFTGQFHGVDHTGMTKRDDEFLTQACLERSCGVFTKFSLGGATESVAAISPATVLGAIPRIGTGLNSVVYRDSENKEYVNDDISEHASARMLSQVSELTLPPVSKTGSTMAAAGIHMSKKVGWQPTKTADIHAVDDELPEDEVLPPQAPPTDTYRADSPTHAMYRAESPTYDTSANISPGNYTMYAPASPTPNVQGPGTLAGSLQNRNIVPAQMAPKIVSANDRLEKHHVISPKIGEIAPDVVLQNISSGGSIIDATGTPQLDAAGFPPYQYKEMEALRAITPRHPPGAGMTSNHMNRNRNRNKSPSLSDSDADQEDDHLNVVQLEEELPSLYGIIDEEQADKDNLAAQMGDNSQPLSDLEDMPDEDDLQGEFVPYSYAAPMSEIARNMERSGM